MYVYTYEHSIEFDLCLQSPYLFGLARILKKKNNTKNIAFKYCSTEHRRDITEVTVQFVTSERAV